MAGNAQVIGNYLKALNQARSSIKPIASLTETFGSISTEDAYQVQLKMLEDKENQGERLIGWKVGLTNPAVWDSFPFPIKEPVFGWITDRNDYSGCIELSRSSFCFLRMEAEIDLVLKATLKGPGVTTADVVSATSGAMAAIELVGGRLTELKSITDLVADDSSHVGLMLGPFMKPIIDFDLRWESVMISKNGHHLASACGCEVLGNPINVVRWLANKLAQFGRELSAGSIISTGSLAKIIPLEPGDVMNISFRNLGNIQFAVTK